MPYKDKEQKREHARKWKAARRAEYSDNRVCEYCGKPATDWHHLDPDKKEGHNIWTWKRERIEAELAKCVPVCEKCHQKIHHPRKVQHGSKGMYSDHGCRCELCRKAVAKEMREYRKGKAGN